MPMLEVLIDDGFHVPVMAGKLVELVGKVGATLFKHNGPIAAKLGIMEVVISISIVAVVAHCPALGVKV